MCLADLAWAGRLATSSPRRARCCARQLARLAERGWSANASTELEFLVFRDSYEAGLAQGLPRPRAGQPLQRRLLAARHRPRRAADPADPQRDGRAPGWRSRTPRASATSASTRSTSATPTRCARADEHSIYKNGAKEIAAQEGMAITLHGQVRRARGQLVPHPLLARRRRRDRCSHRDRALFESFLAGQLACLRELTLLLAPNINSYKRYAAGLVRADRGRVGRTTTGPARCASSATGRALRFENRAGGSDLNPYLALQRDDRRRPARRRARASSSSRPTRATPTWPPTSRGCRRRCATRATCSPTSEVARGAFGDEVVDHYVHAADVELAAFDAAVTDWERFRGFERL